MSATVHARAASPPPRSTLPALAIGLAPVFEEKEVTGSGRPTADFSDQDVRPEGHHDDAGHRRGRQDHRLRAQVQPDIDEEARDPYTRTSRSRTAACTSAARSATSRPRSASSAQWASAACTTSRARSPAAPAGAPAGPLLHARAQSTSVEVGPRFSVNSDSSASRRATRASRWTASASTYTRIAPDGAQACRGPDLSRAEDQAADPRRASSSSPSATGSENGAAPSAARLSPEAGVTAFVLESIEAHARCRAARGWLMFRKVPRGTKLVRHASARRRCSRSSRRR